MNKDKKKVLLLNAGNMEAYPVYPYAFVQVPAVARQYGIDVICKDLLGIPQGNWEASLQALIAANDPAMVLITLRNTDTLSAEDYEQGSKNAYFPIERTRELVEVLRKVTELKIAVGGFAFSFMPDEIMRYLRPDYGVVGGPDDFFANFDDVLAGKLDEVANLISFEGGHLKSNQRVFFSPLEGTEYTPWVIKEMMAFYGQFPSPGFEGAPVEIIRGCPHSCRFCSEPLATGNQVRYRDLFTVMQEIEMLVDQGITKIYMICSELNPEGNEYALQLAELILAFNRRQPDNRKIKWFGANYLLNFSPDEFETLYQSGLAEGWFDITALDDENARTMRTPYRNETLLGYLGTYAQIERKHMNLIKQEEKAKSIGSEYVLEASRKDKLPRWTMFLGNPATKMETIRKTLRIANQEGLAQRFDHCFIIKNLRVFDYEEPDESTLGVTYSVTPDLARTDYQQMLPSFAYPPVLLDVLGSEKEVEQMFEYISDTFLSMNYRKTRDWGGFLQQNIPLKSIRGWVEALAALNGGAMPELFTWSSNNQLPVVLVRLFSEGEDEGMSKKVVETLLTVGVERFPEVFRLLGLPDTMGKLDRLTPYRLAVLIFSKWHTEEALFDALMETIDSVLNEQLQGFMQFCIKALLHRFDIRLNPKYRALFVID